MSKILLVANDLSPLSAFRPTKAELEKRGHTCPLIEGRPEQVNMFLSAMDVDMIVTGMSAPEPNAEVEVNALKCAVATREEGKGIRIAYFSDRRDCWRGREYFNFAKGEADLLFVTLPSEVDEAKAMYPKARIIACGHPAREGNGPTMPREAVRMHILGEACNDRWIVLCAGTKLPDVNIALIDGVLEASSGYPGIIVPVYSPHPGDKTDHDVYRGKGMRVIPKDELPSLEILSGADMVVNALSTLSYECAVLRIPVTCFCPEGSVIANARKSVFGADGIHPPEIQEGTMLLATGALTLQMDFSQLVKNGLSAFGLMRRLQAELYPGWQATGTAVKIMADAIEEILKPASVTT